MRSMVEPSMSAEPALRQELHGRNMVLTVAAREVDISPQINSL